MPEQLSRLPEKRFDLTLIDGAPVLVLSSKSIFLRWPATLPMEQSDVRRVQCRSLQLCPAKSPRAFSRATRPISRVVSKALFELAISKFESSRLSHPVQSLELRWPNAREGPQTRGPLRFPWSPSFQYSNQVSQFRWKVSRASLENSHFAERRGGDWFDIALTGRGSSTDRVLPSDD